VTSDFRSLTSGYCQLPAACCIFIILDFLDSDLVKVYKKAYLELGKGDVAQLGERSVRNAEVVGSNPIVSTNEC
jgi:hypothetical protein